MSQIDKEAFKKHMKEALCLITDLACTRRDEMSNITKEYVDKLLETAGLNPKNFDVDYEHIWSYVIGFCYGRRAGKDTEGK